MRAESALQSEIMLRLRLQHPELVACAIPNGMWLFGADKTRAAIIVRNMKRDGLLTPGAADIVIVGQGRLAFFELKVPPSRDLLGKRRQAGQLSVDQRLFAARCIACGVPYFVCHDWLEVEAAIAAVWVDAAERAA